MLADKDVGGPCDPRQESLTSKRVCFTLWEAPASAESTVLEYLGNYLPHISKDSWPSRLELGGIYFNGRRLLINRSLEFPCRIEYFEPKFKIEEAEKFFPKLSEADIIYRKDGIIAVCKPAGLPTMPSKDQLLYSLRSEVNKLIGTSASIHMPSRLDTSVSGLIIMSEDPRLHAAIQDVFERKRISKRYLAKVLTTPSWEATEINLPIARDLNWGVLRRIDLATGKPSLTKVSKLVSSSDIETRVSSSVLAVYPLTGRTHQIRLHLSAIGLPIIGDRFYGGLEATDLHLVSESVTFKHPKTQENLNIALPKLALPFWCRNV